MSASTSYLRRQPQQPWRPEAGDRGSCTCQGSVVPRRVFCLSVGLLEGRRKGCEQPVSGADAWERSMTSSALRIGLEQSEAEERRNLAWRGLLGAFKACMVLPKDRLRLLWADRAVWGVGGGHRHSCWRRGRRERGRGQERSARGLGVAMELACFVSSEPDPQLVDSSGKRR